MRHCTFESIHGAIQAAVAGDRESAWILDRVRDQGILLELRGEEAGPRVVHIPVSRTLRSLMFILREEGHLSDEQFIETSVAYIDMLPVSDEEAVPAIFVANRECHPFWFGLKVAAECLLYERSYDYSLLKDQIVKELQAIAPKTRAERPQLAVIRRDSHRRLRGHATETQMTHERLIYRAINRELRGALNRLAPCIHNLSDATDTLLDLTERTFPEPMSLEEDAARSILMARASAYLANKAGPASRQN